MKRETLLTLAPSSIRRLANYALEYVEVERDNGYAEGGRGKLLLRLEATAKTMLRDTSKRRLKFAALSRGTPAKED